MLATFQYHIHPPALLIWSLINHTQQHTRCFHEEVMKRFNSDQACYCSVQNSKSATYSRQKFYNIQKYTLSQSLVRSSYICVGIYVCILWTHRLQKVPLPGPQNQCFHYAMRCMTLLTKPCIYIFENELFRATAVQQRQHVNEVCRFLMAAPIITPGYGTWP